MAGDYGMALGIADWSTNVAAVDRVDWARISEQPCRLLQAARSSG